MKTQIGLFFVIVLILNSCSHCSDKIVTLPLGVSGAFEKTQIVYQEKYIQEAKNAIISKYGDIPDLEKINPEISKRCGYSSMFQKADIMIIWRKVNYIGNVNSFEFFDNYYVLFSNNREIIGISNENLIVDSFKGD